MKIYRRLRLSRPPSVEAAKIWAEKWRRLAVYAVCIVVIVVAAWLLHSGG
jgi:hypothetical protein